MAKEKKTEEKIRISGMHPFSRAADGMALLTRTPAFAINVLPRLMVSIIWLIPILTNDTLSKQIGNLRITKCGCTGLAVFMAAGYLAPL